MQSSPPTASFAASSGLTSPAATVTRAPNTNDLEYFTVPDTVNDVFKLYQNQSGVAVSMGDYPSLDSVQDAIDQFLIDAQEMVDSVKTFGLFPHGLPADFLHWTPISVEVSANGRLLAINCLEGVLRADAFGVLRPVDSNPAEMATDLTVFPINGDGVTTTFALTGMKGIIGDPKLMHAYKGGVEDTGATFANLMTAPSVTFSTAPSNGAATAYVTGTARLRNFVNAAQYIVFYIFIGQSWVLGSNDANPVTGAVATSSPFSGRVRRGGRRGSGRGPGRA